VGYKEAEYKLAEADNSRNPRLLDIFGSNKMSHMDSCYCKLERLDTFGNSNMNLVDNKIRN